MHTKALILAALLAACATTDNAAAPEKEREATTTENTTAPEKVREAPPPTVAKRVAIGAKIEVFGAT